MKKKLLIIPAFGFILSAAGLQAQNISGLDKLPKSPTNYVENIPTAHATETPQNPNSKYQGSLPWKKAAVNAVVIGTTNYDLQTNASVGRRVLPYSGGKVSAVWTTSADQTSEFPLRGSGYNHFDGTNWGASSNTRIETDRTGWPSIITLPNNTEMVVSHNATSGGLRFTTNTAIGGKSWTTSAIQLTYPDGRPIWCRVANNGNTIHVLQNFSDSSLPSEKQTYINGILNPTVYSRSTDGGATWVDKHILLPGYDTNTIARGSGDSYAIDVRGDIVAIVIADNLGGDVALWKSLNGGATFTKTVIDTFPFPKYRSNQVIGTGVQTNDGSCDVVIDLNGKVHVAYGLGRVTQNHPSTDSAFFLPGTSGIVYWNETTPKQIVAGVNDANNNDSIDILPGTWTALNNGNIPGGLIAVSRIGVLSLSSMPSLSLDANGNVYMVYTSAVESDDFGNACSFRDIYVVSSKDGGTTWDTTLQNISKGLQLEDAFASSAKEVDGFLHVIWQRDELPGTNLQNNSSGNSHPITENSIMYAAVPASEILTGAIGGDPKNTVSVSKGTQVYVAGNLYPNPTSGYSTALIYLNNTSEVSYEISTITGAKITGKNMGLLTTGNHEVNIDATGLTPGVYLVNIQAEGSRVTKKLIVQ